MQEKEIKNLLQAIDLSVSESSGPEFFLTKEEYQGDNCIFSEEDFKRTKKSKPPKEKSKKKEVPKDENKTRVLEVSFGDSEHLLDFEQGSEGDLLISDVNFSFESKAKDMSAVHFKEFQSHLEHDVNIHRQKVEEYQDQIREIEKKIRAEEEKFNLKKKDFLSQLDRMRQIIDQDYPA